MKKVLKTILRVYMIICTCLFSLLIIAGLIAWINFGKITAFAVEKVVDSYNDELTGIVSNFIKTSVPDDSFQLESIQTLKGGGIQASFVVDNSALADIDISQFQDKTTEELIAEFGISIGDIPEEIIPILSMVQETLVLNFKDANGNPVFNHEITAKEISELLKAGL